jgi:hypothetical protein
VKLLQFVHKNIPNRFKPVVFEILKGASIQIGDLIDLKELDFSFLHKDNARDIED